MSEIGILRCAGWQALLAAVALMLSVSVWAENRPAIPSVKKETKSQATLRKVMEDVRRCNKSVLYEYDPKTKQVYPPELQKIKGFRFVRQTYGFAVFRIDEIYERMHARFLWMRMAGSGNGNMFAVAFDGGYQLVRQRFEELWDIRFETKIPPDPDGIVNTQYADIELIVDGKRRWLSVGVPVEFPPITIPEVGCNAWEN